MAEGSFHLPQGIRRLGSVVLLHQHVLNTNLQAVFDMLLRTAQSKGVRPKDMPQKLYIISDMEFDGCLGFGYHCGEDRVNTLLEIIATEWAREGYELPKVVFWNLRASTNNIPALGGRFSYVSGFSMSMIETILSGKDGYDLMLEKLMSERYSLVGQDKIEKRRVE